MMFFIVGVGNPVHNIQIPLQGFGNRWTDLIYESCVSVILRKRIIATPTSLFELFNFQFGDLDKALQVEPPESGSPRHICVQCFTSL